MAKRKTKNEASETPAEVKVEAPAPTDLSAPAEHHEPLFEQEGELVCDVFENGKEFVVLAAIAGVAIKDLDISVEKDMMVIKGKRTNPHHHPDNKFFTQECWWGPFSKKVVLPENVDTENADAQMDKGILTVRIPKMSGEPPQQEPQQVEVS